MAKDDLPHVGSAETAERRRFFRVPTQLRVDLFPIARSELDALTQLILARTDPGPAIVPPPLLAVLQRIESKLDHVIAAVEGPSARPQDSATGRVIAISGAGMRVVSKDRPGVGERVLAEFMLPGGFASIRSVAEVVRHIEPRRPEDEPQLALSFRVIHEADREAIVHFCLEVERAGRRAVRQAGDLV